MDVSANRVKRVPFVAAWALGLVAVLVAACGPGEDGDGGGGGPTGNGDPPAAGASAAPELTVTSPADGETVTMPFEVQVDSSVPLGAIDQELHHLHIWFGDTSGQPLIVESDSTMIEEAPDGDTTMIVQVHTFDHQPASDQVSVPLVVQGGSEGDSSNGPPGYDY